MATVSELPPVLDNQTANRFELTVDGHLSALTYRVVGPRLALIHTEVPHALEGRGIGGALVRAALARAVDEKLVLVPKCPFARSWLEEHASETEGVEIDWGT
jgi:predicted GNAT family acetyltransferase